MELLSDDQKAALVSLGSPIRFLADETIFLEGQPSHCVLLVEQGNLKVTRQAADGTEVTLAVRGSGEVMGEEGVLMGETRDSTVTAITEVNGLSISAEQLLSFVEEQHLWPMMHRAAVRRRRQSDQRALLARLDVGRRLVQWLLELAAEVGEDDENGLAIPSTLSQQDLAWLIGASTDAVLTELRGLRSSGLVSIEKYRIVLHDPEALSQLAQQLNKKKQSVDQLGPFGVIWEAWNEARDEIINKPLSHFKRAVEVQFEEITEHLAVGDRAAAGREIVDVISIAFNSLRWLGYQPQDVAEIVRSRVEWRMRGQALAILDKYQRLYGI